MNALVTGATGKIGEAIVFGLLERGYKVFALGKDDKKLQKLKENTKSRYKNAQIECIKLDLSSIKEMLKFCNDFDESLDVLINNAATAPINKVITKEGYEMVFVVNILSYLILSQELLKNLKKGQKPRIVNVASYWAGDLDINDLEFTKRAYNNHIAYRQSKQANRMLSFYDAKRFAEFNISVNSCHPGEVNSKLSNDLGFGGYESPEQGAATPLYLATTDVGYKESGKYFEYQKEVVDRFIKDFNEIKKLYEICVLRAYK